MTLLGVNVVVEVVRLMRGGEAEVQNQREGSIESVAKDQKFTRLCLISHCTARLRYRCSSSAIQQFR
jgi:hypothetical protein